LRHIDEKYLPKKYGGKIDGLEFNRMEFYELLLKYQDDFEGESSEAVAKGRFLYLCCRDGTFSNENLPTQHSIRHIFLLYLCKIVIQCYTGYWFSVAFPNICLFTASSGVRFFCLITLFTSFAHFISDLPLFLLLVATRSVFA
jgi:hypothetical protein